MYAARTRLGVSEHSIIKFGYWDSLKKGLLAGDLLCHDLKRLDIAFIDGNLREHEMTKHVSMLAIAPEQLLALKEGGVCHIDVPEWLFDLDTPGHFMRRLKMVSLTIPCVTGPYTAIHCKLVLEKSSYRKVDSGDVYERSASDAHFIDDRRVLDAIVTSSGQNDAGLFEPAIRFREAGRAEGDKVRIGKSGVMLLVEGTVESFTMLFTSRPVRTLHVHRAHSEPT